MSSVAGFLADSKKQSSASVSQSASIAFADPSKRYVQHLVMDPLRSRCENVLNDFSTPRARFGSPVPNMDDDQVSRVRVRLLEGNGCLCEQQGMFFVLCSWVSLSTIERENS